MVFPFGLFGKSGRFPINSRKWLEVAWNFVWFPLRTVCSLFGSGAGKWQLSVASLSVGPSV